MKKVNVSSALLRKCWLLLLAVAVLFAGCGSSGETADTQSTVQAEPETAEVTEAVITEEAFVAVLKDALAGAVGEGESIADVVLSNGDLRVVVDMSNADPAPLTLADLVWLKRRPAPLSSSRRMASAPVPAARLAMAARRFSTPSVRAM